MSAAAKAKRNDAVHRMTPQERRTAMERELRRAKREVAAATGALCGLCVQASVTPRALHAAAERTALAAGCLAGFAHLTAHPRHMGDFVHVMNAIRSLGYGPRGRRGKAVRS